MTSLVIDDGKKFGAYVLDPVAAVPRSVLVHDDWCIGYWLASTASKSAHTKRCYLKEVKRWRAFLAMSAQARFDSPEDLICSAEYADAGRFLAWIGSDDGPAIPANIATRFGLTARQALKPKASAVVLRQAAIILHGFYEELLQARFPGSSKYCCEVNPFKPYRRRFAASKAEARSLATPDAIGVSKALSDAAWQAVWVAVQQENDGASLLAARRRLVISMLRATWERRHAVSSMTWADLQRSRDGVWNIRRDRKGVGLMWAPIPLQLVEELLRFRRLVGLPASATIDELPRSIFWMGGRSAGHDGPLHDQTIYRIVKQVFEIAACALDAQARCDVAAELRRAGAGPHTIRHTMATMYMSTGGEARHAQEALGHASIVTTTSTYDSRTQAGQVIELEKQWQTSEAKA